MIPAVLTLAALVTVTAFGVLVVRVGERRATRFARVTGSSDD